MPEAHRRAVARSMIWFGSPRASRPLSASVQATNHQLFTTPDALRQAAVMGALAGRVPVPRIWLTESDSSVLGAPFFLMDRVDGLVPSDVPSWHKRGWAIDLTVDQRAELHDNALRALTVLHGLSVDGSLAFLGGGTAIGSPAAVLDRARRSVLRSSTSHGG